MSQEPFQFSDKVRKLLERAGWSPDRRIDTSEHERVLTGMGCPFFPAVEDFLSRFGGLELYYDIKFHTVLPLCLDFGTGDYELFQEEDVQQVAEKIGKPLCLIGVIAGFEAMFLMDAEGCVYNWYPHSSPLLLGHSGEEAIDNHLTLNFTLNYPEEAGPEGPAYTQGNPAEANKKDLHLSYIAPKESSKWTAQFRRAGSAERRDRP